MMWNYEILKKKKEVIFVITVRLPVCHTKSPSDLFPLQVENGLIVVAYKDGSPAHAHQLNSELMLEYWNTWLVRLGEFTDPR